MVLKFRNKTLISVFTTWNVNCWLIKLQKKLCDQFLWRIKHFPGCLLTTYFPFAILLVINWLSWITKLIREGIIRSIGYFNQKTCEEILLVKLHQPPGHWCSIKDFKLSIIFRKNCKVVIFTWFVPAIQCKWVKINVRKWMRRCYHCWDIRKYHI